MSKILICFSSHIYVKDEFKIISYYEGLIKELHRHHNDVLVCNTADFLTKPWAGKNSESSIIDGSRLRSYVENYSPDLIISFNNSKLSFLEELECPIIIWQADSFEFYNDKETIKSNPNRYLYFGLSDDDQPLLRNIGVNKDNLFVVPSGTTVCASSIEQDKSISFIGSNFISSGSLTKLLIKDNTKDVRDALKFLSENFYIDSDEYLNKHDLGHVSEYMDHGEISTISSCQNRINVLGVLLELGLELYGSRGWLTNAKYYPGLALAFNSKTVYSVQDNQDIYNSSKLCLNISHAQAVGAFPWRIMDIMASNGCLLSNYNKGVRDFASSYIDLPMYKSSGEAYSIAKKLLKDDVYRRELVEGSQICIEEKGRWKHRFEEIEMMTGIKIDNTNKSGECSVTILQSSEYVKESYRQAIKFAALVAKSAPRALYSPVYNSLVKMGFEIDYRTVKKIMEDNDV